MRTSAGPAEGLVLIADPNEDTRTMYGTYLRTLSYEIDEADDGDEALGKSVAHRPSVIVTETRLPLVSGLELCRLLRQDALTCAIPIVVVTADAGKSHLSLA